ncbi:MAG: DNA-directed DNA polymerase I [Candidatus Bathyarchaeota archaeon]|uniref:DNA-directed DNA polymerase I n=1 Tax=Candidatus Bathycorpusculum sp. TaxID=2994959 RepID=UPI00281DC19D|nr:DNA-directed DNA polymerase I [Candidatus Termiticorpusculum sp.]MCL2257688.1 DNA-directed DNA polymerase I [Candidatus Termiticorpusculum sp.]MCL2292187.1 DNA-directed DNA polymerase I [Candidatus Termiticorpusculum sp.]
MAPNKTLDSFFTKESKQVAAPQVESKVAQAEKEFDAQVTQMAADEEKIVQFSVKKEREQRVLPPIAPPDLSSSYFVSASYDGRQRKVIIKLYEPESGELYFWQDNTGHKPYCLTSLPKEKVLEFDRIVKHQGFDSCITEQKFDPLANQSIQVTKIVAKDPLAIGGRPSGTIRDIIPEDHLQVCGCQIQDSDTKIWESKIKYYQSYIYDQRLLPGMIYQVKNGRLEETSVCEAEQSLGKIREIFSDETAEEQEFAEMWAKLLEYPAPKFRRAAIDIEVYSPLSNRVPDAREGAYPVIACSIYSSEGDKKVFVLKRQNRPINEKTQIPIGVDVEFCETEEYLLQQIFKVLNDFPFILTFNGDDFDLRYLVHRALNLGIAKKDIPIDVGKRVCLIKYGIHIDLYKFFFNRSIQGYAFNNRYKDVSLGDVGAALLGMEKIHLNKAFGDLSYNELAHYCLRDSEITYKLTSFEDDAAMKLILVLTRISSMPMEDVSRQGVSRWIRNFLHREHRKHGLLIPNAEDILTKKGKTSTTATIKGKKYKGAIVVEPTPGVHFNVAVMDFPSLYPSIIKVWNLGYQSIDCIHPECKKQMIPDTQHWVCTKKRALESLLIGSLRDLRVRWYKNRAKDQTLPIEVRNWYNTVQGALKVILNASYGVFGADSFDLYCPPVAEATAAIGRYSITQILEHAEATGVKVLYGDTDSLFLKNPSKEQIEEIAHWTEQHLNMNIDVDKVYRYAVFSARKKNYLGVLENGTVDVKGLTGKKKHIPVFIKDAFNQMKERLAKVKTPAEFENAKKDIANIVKDRYTRLKRREWNDNTELAFHVVLGDELSRYTKTTPQHVKAALILQKSGKELRAGDLISFVKVNSNKERVKPVELTYKNEVDTDKYIAYLQSTFDQVLDALGLNFEEIIGLTKLAQFFV